MHVCLVSSTYFLLSSEVFKRLDTSFCTAGLQSEDTALYFTDWTFPLQQPPFVAFSFSSFFRLMYDEFFLMKNPSIFLHDSID